MKIVTPNQVAAWTLNVELINHEVEFDFTYTSLDEPVVIEDQLGEYVIDINGAIHDLEKTQSPFTRVKIIGGTTKFAGEFRPLDSSFFLTNNQRSTLSAICRQIGIVNRFADLTSPNERLETIINAMKNNYGG